MLPFNPIKDRQQMACSHKMSTYSYLLSSFVCSGIFLLFFYFLSIHFCIYAIFFCTMSGKRISMRSQTMMQSTKPRAINYRQTFNIFHIILYEISNLHMQNYRNNAQIIQNGFYLQVLHNIATQWCIKSKLNFNLKWFSLKRNLVI